MLAASHGHANVTKALLAAGADARIRNNKRDRARDIAALAGNPLEQHENSKSWLKKWWQLTYIKAATGEKCDNLNIFRNS